MSAELHGSLARAVTPQRGSAKTPSENGRERELFLAALEISPADRGSFLDAACGSDAAFRARVEALLHEEQEVGSFLETPALSGARPVAATGPNGTVLIEAVTEKPGDRIGRYKLLQKIGEGGCGIVYMAEQEEPVRRRVALKVIKLGMDTKSVIARFEAERQALAMMDHPNIAKVLDAGATETGRPFFVMELVRGVKITEYCDDNHLPTEERLKLLIQVCQAIQHAHQKGIIHRDIKPSNVLVTLHDGVPVPKIIDFGIAKATEQRLTNKTLFTEFTTFIGTPAYMSPEQAEMSGLDIDTRSDIYSLGVLLYELLTGKTPFDAEALLRGSLDECRRTIREKEPARPSTRLATMLAMELTTTAQQRRTDAPKLIHLLRGDLDWVVMKALEKDRARRYPTANALAEDIQRYLRQEPVLARPPSTIYRLQKLARRNRTAFAAAASITITLIAGIAISTSQAIRATKAEHRALSSSQQETKLRQVAEKERGRAEQESAAAQLNEYIADISLAQQSLAAGNYGRALQLLAKHEPQADEADLRGFEWRFLWQISQGDAHISLPKQVDSPTFTTRTSDSSSPSPPERVWVNRTKTGPPPLPASPDKGSAKEQFRQGPGHRGGGFDIRRNPSDRGGIQSLTISANGELLAVGFSQRFSVWNVRTKSIITNIAKGAISLTFLPDGKTLITASGNTTRLWNTADWSERKTLSDNSAPIATSHDGARLATSSREGVHIWDTSSWKELRLLPEPFSVVAISTDGNMLATERPDGIALWSLAPSNTGPANAWAAPVVLQDSSNLVTRFGPSFRTERALAFSPDGKSIVAARNTLSERGVFVLSIWDTQTGKEIAVMPDDPEHIEHTGVITSLAFSSDGRTLATASMDYSIRLWDFASRQRLRTLQGHAHGVSAIAFSADGNTLASAAKEGEVKVWPTRPPQQEEMVSVARLPLAFSKDSRTLAALSRDAVVFVNLGASEPEQQFPIEHTRPHSSSQPGVALSENLRTLVESLDDGSLKIWDTETRESTTLKTSDRFTEILALSPDGRNLITGGWSHHVRWWDLRTSTNITTELDANRVLFSPNGGTFAAFARGNTIEIWDTASRSVRTNIVAESQPGLASAFSPDGRLLAVACQDDGIYLFDVASGKLLGVCVGHKQSVATVAFSTDGKTLASGSDDSTLKLWNVATQQELLSIRRLGGALRGLMFSPDGRILVGGSSSLLKAGGLRFYRAPQLAEIEKGLTN